MSILQNITENRRAKATIRNAAPLQNGKIPSTALLHKNKACGRICYFCLFHLKEYDLAHLHIFSPFKVLFYIN